MEVVTEHKLKELRIILDSNEIKNYFQEQNVQIKEEVVSDDEPTDLQPDSQVDSQEYQIKSEVVDSSTLPSVKQLEDEHEHTQKLFSCSLCKRNNMLRISFKQHLIHVHRLNNEEILKNVPEFYQCKYCPHQFCRLHQHEGSHTLPFKCDMCDKRYGQKQSLQLHKLAHSEPQIPCPHCDKKYRQKTRLTDHIESLHSVHKCDQCQKKFKCRKYPMEHIKYIHNKTNQNSWKCDECEKCFQFKSKLEKHIFCVHKTVSKNFFCLHCNVKFKLNSSLKHHIKIKHNSFVCIDCSLNPRNYPKTCNEPNSEGLSKPVGQSFELQNQHVKEEISEDIGPVIQQISDVYMEDYQEENIITEVNYRLESTMNDKVETTDENDVEIETEITIDEMDRSTIKTEESTEEGHSVSSQNETSAYKQEQVEHLEDKHNGTKTLFSCSLCKEERMGLEYFKAHLTIIHHLKSEEISKYIPKFYQCKYCPSQFKAPSLLHKHEGSHTLPFICDICEKRFGRKDNLKTHKLIHSSECQFPCPHCDLKFSQQSTLANHIESIHGGDVHKCDQCEKKYKWRGSLFNHIKKHHTITH